ncbi:MAG TPA: hypothetical protein VII32_13690 [Thermoanaerobaculia bacterium]
MIKWFVGALVAIATAERRRPLPRVESDPPRVSHNLAIGAITAVVTAALQKPLVGRAGHRGLLRRMKLAEANPLGCFDSSPRLHAVVVRSIGN